MLAQFLLYTLAAWGLNARARSAKFAETFRTAALGTEALEWPALETVNGVAVTHINTARIQALAALALGCALPYFQSESVCSHRFATSAELRMSDPGGGVRSVFPMRYANCSRSGNLSQRSSGALLHSVKIRVTTGNWRDSGRFTREANSGDYALLDRGLRRGIISLTLLGALAGLLSGAIPPGIEHQLPWRVVSQVEAELGIPIFSKNVSVISPPENVNRCFATLNRGSGLGRFNGERNFLLDDMSGGNRIGANFRSAFRHWKEGFSQRHLANCGPYPSMEVLSGREPPVFKIETESFPPISNHNFTDFWPYSGSLVGTNYEKKLEGTHKNEEAGKASKPFRVIGNSLVSRFAEWRNGWGGFIEGCGVGLLYCGIVLLAFRRNWIE